MPFPLVAGFLLFLCAPALVHHVATNPLPPRYAFELEPSSLPEDLRVEISGAPTSTVTVAVPYTVTGPEGTWVGQDELLNLTATVSGLTPTVRVVVTHADRSKETVTVRGVLVVTGDVLRDATIQVKNGDDVPFEARVKAQSPPSVTLRLGEKTITHEAGGLSFEDDPAGDTDATRFVAENVLPHLDGIPVDDVPGGDAYPPLASLAESANGVRFSILGDTVTLNGAGLSGDPFAPEGLVASRGADGTLVTLRARPPTSVRDTVRIEAEGPAVALLRPGATRVALDASVGTLPIGLVTLRAGTVGSESDHAVHVMEATTGGYLVSLASEGAGTVYANAPLDEYAAVPRLDYATDVAAGGVVTVVGRSADGTEAICLRAGAGEPSPLKVTFGPGWPQSGVAPVDHALSSATGLVTTVQGTAANPERVTVAPLGGLPFFDAERGDDGSVIVTYPGVTDVVPGGTITLAGDPSGVAPYSVIVQRAGTDVVTVRVQREPLLAGSGLARPVVTVQTTLGVGPVTVAPPFAFTGNLADRRLTGFTLYSPLDPSESYLSVERTAAGWRVTTPAAAHEVGGALFTFEGDPLSSNDAAFSLKDASRTELARIAVDRAAGTARVTGLGEPQVLRGPVQYSGDPANPTRVVVLAPDASGEILRYERSATGPGGSLSVLGEERVKNSALLEMRGTPGSGSGFSFVVRDVDGGTLKSFDVSAAAALAAGSLPAELREPVVSILDSSTAGSRHLTHVLDASGARLDRDALLTGGAWLSLAGPHDVRLEVPASDDVFTRIRALHAARVAPDGSSPSAAFERLSEGKTHVYGASLAPQGGSGDALHLVLRYDTALSPFAVASVEERGYAYRLDGVGPVARASAPASSENIRFTVSWSGEDAESGVAAFAVERRIGDGPWERWIERSPGKSAVFTGEPGKTYAFRARGFDRVGNAGAWSEAVTTTVSAAADGTNAPPTVRILHPLGGENLAGVVTVEWEAVDPDGAEPVVNLYASPDAGVTWKSLYSGAESSYAWDTTVERSGTSWRLKVLVTDGSLEDADATGRFTVRNLVTAGDGLSSGEDGRSSSDDDGSDGSGREGDEGVTEKSTAGLLVAVVAGVLLVGGVAVAWVTRRGVR